MLLSLVLVLGACGGGGSDGGGTGGSSNAGPPPDSSGGGGTPVPTNSWFIQRLGTSTDNLYPGNTYQPVGGEPPYALWLMQGSDNSVTLNETVASRSSRGFSTVTHMSNLPSVAHNNSTAAVKAGHWSMLAWTEWDSSAATPTQLSVRNLFLRLKGDTFDSGPVKVSSNLSGSLWNAKLVLDATGRARAYWDEDNRLGVNGQFVNGVWTPLPDLGESISVTQRYLVAPDGQGKLFYNRYLNGLPQHYFRRISAANGLGPEVRLDDPAQGLALAQRVASAEGPQGFTTATFQQVANASSGCLAVRRMVAGSLQAPLCIPVSGDALPNRNHVSLASDVSGHAVLVWSTGPQDQALYVSRRDTAGVWSTPALLAHVTVGSPDFSSLSGVRTAISPSGQALVIFRASDDFYLPSTTRALVGTVDGRWSAVAKLALSGMTNRDVALAFNAQGVPGVLQLMAESRDTDAVMMSTWTGGQWKSELLRSGIQLAFYNEVQLSTVRLAPQGTTGWLALWDEGHGRTTTTGYRELWAAEYR